MKSLFVFIAFIIVLIITSSVFIHFSNSLAQPSSADKYNSYLKKWDRTILAYCIYYKQKGLDYLNKCFEIFDDTTPSDPDHVKQCSNTCPLPKIGNEPLVKAKSSREKATERIYQEIEQF